MQIQHPITIPKTQTKANDCWYACIQILKSYKNGVKTKTTGNAAQTHRANSMLGRTLGFDSAEGQEVMRENNLKDVATDIALDDIATLHKALLQHGPVIVGGQFGIFNTQGHFIVITGCNTTSGDVTIYDPFWAHGKATKSWKYITKHIWKSGFSALLPAGHSVIACR